MSTPLQRENNLLHISIQPAAETLLVPNSQHKTIKEPAIVNNKTERNFTAPRSNNPSHRIVHGMSTPLPSYEQRDSK